MSSYIGWKIVDDSADDGTLLVESPQGHRRRVLFEATMADHIGGTNEKVEPSKNVGELEGSDRLTAERCQYEKEIAELQQQNADLKFERRFCPSVERWAEVQSELAAYKERAVVQDGELAKVTHERDAIQTKLAAAEALLREVLATAGSWEYLPKYGIVMTQEWMNRAKGACGE